jgi:hypothetical protein
MHRTLRIACLSLACAAALSGCARESTTAAAPKAETAAPAAPLKPVDSVIGLMANQVAPAAQSVWDAVGTVVGPKGPVEKAPRSDAEWAALRSRALQLIEAGNLLQIPGRVTSWPGEKRANPPGANDLTPEQADALLRKDWPAFVAFSQALQAQAIQALKAIDERNLDGISDAGGNIDEACEACHKKFWYPETK